MASKGRILVIEDEPDILEVIAYNLQRESFQVISSKRGDEGMELVRLHLPLLVILDLMLPGLGGLEVCQCIKADSRTKNIPIVMVSAKGEERDVIHGLGLGADDYLPKPFSPKELVARVKAVIRRGPLQEYKLQEPIIFKDLVIDVAGHEVKIANTLVKLTATEFRLLQQLASNPGRVFSREQLLDKVVGEGVVVVDRNIDVHVRSIRKKLARQGDLIETIRGIGYRFASS